MAENRVTEEHLQVAVVRDSVPGNARVTEEHLQVAVLRTFTTNIRVTEAHLQVAVLRTNQARSQGIIIF